jgi:bacteriocin-like protein
VNESNLVPKNELNQKTDEFNAVSKDELNQIEGGGMLPRGTGPVQLPPQHGGFGGGGAGAHGSGGSSLDGTDSGGGAGPGFIWGNGDPKLPD